MAEAHACRAPACRPRGRGTPRAGSRSAAMRRRADSAMAAPGRRPRSTQRSIRSASLLVKLHARSRLNPMQDGREAGDGDAVDVHHAGHLRSRLVPDRGQREVEMRIAREERRAGARACRRDRPVVAAERVAVGSPRRRRAGLRAGPQGDRAALSGAPGGGTDPGSRRGSPGDGWIGSWMRRVQRKERVGRRFADRGRGVEMLQVDVVPREVYAASASSPAPNGAGSSVPAGGRAGGIRAAGPAAGIPSR